MKNPWTNGNDVPDGVEVEVEIEHCNKSLNLSNHKVKGRIGDDGFYLSCGGELSYNWNIIRWHRV